MDGFVELLVLLVTGAVAGFSSGLAGVGGGFIMVPVQYGLLSGTGLDQTLAVRIAFGTSLAVALPAAVLSAAGHYRRGAVDWRAAVFMGAAAFLAGLAGGTAAAHLPGEVLRCFFAILVIVMGVRMWFPLRSRTASADGSGLPGLLLAGTVVGLISGLAGIGGGIILVPILVLLLGFPMHRAVGTSSACLIFSTSGGVVSYVFNGLGVPGLPATSLGYVDLVWWAALATTSLPLVIAGVRAAHRLPADRLKRIFSVVMIAIGLIMLLGW
jgi:uncharacterized membrane protein YfcA